MRLALVAPGRDARLGRLLQQPLGRAADACADAARQRLRRLRDRHEPCRRDRAADAAWSARMSRSSRRSSRCTSSSSARSGHRRRQGRDLLRPRAGRHRGDQPRQPSFRAAARPCAGLARPGASSASASTRAADVRAERIVAQAGRCRSSRRASSASRSSTASATPGRHVALNSLARARRGAGARRRPRARGARRSPTSSRRPGAASASGSAAAGGEALLIDESYNANPASMRAALANLGRDRASAGAAAASRSSATCCELGDAGTGAAPRARPAAVESGKVDLVFAAGTADDAPRRAGCRRRAAAAMRRAPPSSTRRCSPTCGPGDASWSRARTACAWCRGSSRR